MKKQTIFAIVLMIAFILFGMIMFRQALTPYVSFEDAREGQHVQIAGTLVAGTMKYDAERQTLFFTMKEKEGEDTLPIAYRGSRPANFEDVTSIIAIGAYEGNAFSAEKLLVKCPSKYEESRDGAERTYGGNT